MTTPQPVGLPHPPTTGHVEVASLIVTFSPKGEAEKLVVATIDMAKTSLHVQAYQFSSHAICDAVIRAHARGVAVLVLLDKANKVNLLSKWFNPVGKSSLLPALRAAGVPVLFDSSPPIAHSKVVIADSTTVVTGSFNFSSAAQNLNAENLLVITDPGVASAYEGNFAWRASLSKA